MSPVQREADEVEEERGGKTLSRRGVIALLRINTVLVWLSAASFLGFENYLVMRILAGASGPIANRLDFAVGQWGFDLWRHAPGTAAIKLVALGVIGGLFALSAWGLKHGNRWGAWVGMATNAIFLVINSIMIGAELWQIIANLRNDTGGAFGKSTPQWANVSLIGVTVMLILEALVI